MFIVFSECYNNPEYANGELSTRQVKQVIDQLCAAGCLWLCYTGGEPLVRPDFIELYEYAKSKGLLITIFTSLAVLSDQIFDTLVKKPPFLIETTLNAATQQTYEKISQVKGSFSRVMTNIKRILAAQLPLKMKALVSKNNLHEVKQLGDLMESLGVSFKWGTDIFARLNGDTTPPQYRVPIDALSLEEGLDEDLCAGSRLQTDWLFRCAIGNWHWRVSSYGRLHICPFVREPSYELTSGDISEGIKLLSGYVRDRRFTKESECKNCDLRHLCRWCPGRAKLEVGDEEMPIPYYCRLAKRRAFFGKDIAKAASHQGKRRAIPI